MFISGVFVGILISVFMAIVFLVMWKKFIKKKVDDAIFKAGLKAIESEKERKQ